MLPSVESAELSVEAAQNHFEQYIAYEYDPFPNPWIFFTPNVLTCGLTSFKEDQVIVSVLSRENKN